MLDLISVLGYYHTIAAQHIAAQPRKRTIIMTNFNSNTNQFRVQSILAATVIVVALVFPLLSLASQMVV